MSMSHWMRWKQWGSRNGQYRVLCFDVKMLTNLFVELGRLKFHRVNDVVDLRCTVLQSLLLLFSGRVSTCQKKRSRVNLRPTLRCQLKVFGGEEKHVGVQLTNVNVSLLDDDQGTVNLVGDVIDLLAGWDRQLSVKVFTDLRNISLSTTGTSFGRKAWSAQVFSAHNCYQRAKSQLTGRRRQRPSHHRWRYRCTASFQYGPFSLM